MQEALVSHSELIGTVHFFGELHNLFRYLYLNLDMSGNL